jgi:GT2 family glycosyltransferase
MSGAAIRPDLTVVIVNWNGRGILDDCLRSVFARDPGIGLEVIVVDNASTDGSQAMVKTGYPDAILVENAENRGFAAANNQAMRMARGRHVLLLNSDTIVHGDVLLRTVRFLDERPEVGVLACRVLNRDGTDQQVARPAPSWWRLWLWTLGAEKLAGRPTVGVASRQRLDRERDVGYVAGCFLAVPASTVAAVGMLDEEFFFYGEDADWCERIRRAGKRVVQAPIGSIIHLGGASSGPHSYRRDLMLSSGLVVFNRKFRGRVAALAAAGALWTFYASRLVAFRIEGAVRPNESRMARAAGMGKILAGFGPVWALAWRGRSPAASA